MAASLRLSHNLALGDRRNPRNSNIGDDGNRSDDPKRLSVVTAVVSEYDGKDDTAKVAKSPDSTGHDSY